MLTRLLDLLAPPTCDGCGRRAAPPWCDTCDRTAVVPSPRCSRCGVPALLGHGCWAPGAPVAATVVLRAWRGPVAAALARAKDAGRREVFVAAGARLGAAVADAGRVVDAVVPVPTDAGRARRRGLDHTRAIAGSVAARLDVPVARPVRAAGRLPDRGRVDPGERAALPPGPLRRAGPVPRRVLLVDDVLTTGGTVEEVARLLRAGGADEVVVGVLARAGSRALGASGSRAR